MPKNKIYVTRSSLPEMSEYVDEIKDIWETHWLTNMGTKHEKLRQQLQEYLDVEHMHLMVNGHMALELALICTPRPIHTSEPMKISPPIFKVPNISLFGICNGS